MALYKHKKFLGPSGHEAFDREYPPGTPAPMTGIYRCMGCRREIIAEQPQELPPASHHCHSVMQGTIRWRLIVYADHRPVPAPAG